MAIKTIWKRCRRLLCATLACLTCLGTIACTPVQPPDNDTKEDVDMTTLIDNGVCEYSVVRSELSTSAITDASVEVRNALQNINGGTVDIKDDFVMRGEAIPADTKEILIGVTNRQESIDAHASLKENEFCIRMVGNRLVIVGYDDLRTVKAVEAFLAMLPGMTSEDGKVLALPSDMSLLDQYVIKVWLDEFDKTSYSYYADDKLKYSEEELLGLDGMDDIDYPDSFAIETPDGEDGIGFKTDRDNSHWVLLNTPTDSFHLEIDDKFTQTVKMRVYVNDDDLMVCDHDAVYDTPQVGSQTLYITLASEKGGVGHTWQHTFYGSGWHDIELSFTCHNVAYPNLEKIDYSNLTSLNVWCSAKAGLEVYFDSLRVCEYKNPTYRQPEAPYGGRWLSTCDYEALDGPILTEWYGSYYDLEEKVQGSSSLAITGHNENVDHRVCIGIDDVDVVYSEDTICFDMYISDLSLLGTNWQIRLEHNAQAAHYSVNYSMIQSSVVDERMRPTSLKSGWNHIQLPLNKTNVSIGAGYEDTFTNDLTLTQLVFFIVGTGTTEEQNYLIRYDNMYVAKTADLLAAKEAMK